MGGADSSGSRVLSRRAVLAVAAGAAVAGCQDGAGPAGQHGRALAAGTPRARGWFAPADDAPQARTWMAWPAREDVWGRMLPGVRSDVASVARAIARFEPVAMVARPRQAREAAAACGRRVEIVPLVNDDLWMRDMGPVFLVNGRGGLAGLDMNFNGWGNRQVHPNDAKIAREVLAMMGVPRFTAPFVAEGGALEADGHGTVMATESSIINRNRNPGRSKAQLTADICEHLGARTMIWVPGLRNHDITDDHIDGLARFVRPADVVVDQPANPGATNIWAVSERQALEVLRRSRDAGNRPAHDQQPGRRGRRHPLRHPAAARGLTGRLRKSVAGQASRAWPQCWPGRRGRAGEDGAAGVADVLVERVPARARWSRMNWAGS
ncbi:MAG: agmatine deiminase family protein [Streptosporangiaceae bacterium]